jgi:hypothetical protein
MPESAGDTAAVTPGPADDETGAAEGGVIRNRQRILDYNEDDVRATYALRQWMSQHPDAMPTAASLA